jgi:hypothetical protein
MERNDIAHYASRTITSEPIGRGFVAYPPALLGGLSPEHIAWQQQIYQRAYAEARAAVGYRKFIPVVGREARN